MFPDDPASYPCSMVGGRIGTSGWSLIGARYGHTRDLVCSMEVVLPDRRRHPGRRGRRSEAAEGVERVHAEAAFFGHEGTLGVVTEATLELVPRPQVEFAAFFGYRDYQTAWHSTGALAKSGFATLAGVVLFDELKLAYLRRDDEAYIEQPDWLLSVVAVAMYGNEAEVVPAAREIMRIGRESGGTYLGDEVSARVTGPPATTGTRSRCTAGCAAARWCPMSWHCEDAALNYSVLPRVREEWHAIADRYIRRYGIFDDWGIFAYTNGAYKPWGDYLVEIDIGIWEQKLDDKCGRPG